MLRNRVFPFVLVNLGQQSPDCFGSAALLVTVQPQSQFVQSVKNELILQNTAAVIYSQTSFAKILMPLCIRVCVCVDRQAQGNKNYSFKGTETLSHNEKKVAEEGTTKQSGSVLLIC